MRRRKTNNNGSHLPSAPAESVADLMARAPELYERIVDHLEKDGWSPGAISTLLAVQGQSVHPDTIRRIRALNPGSTHAAIRSIAASMVEATQLLSARVVKEFDQIPPAQMTAALGTLVDKLLLLTGGVTARVEVEHSKKAVSPEELKQMFDQLPKVEGREVTPHSDVPSEG